MPREVKPFILLASLLVVGALVLEHVNGRFWLNDFRVYWSAADALMHGRSVYGAAFGEDTGFYKYAPIVAIGFIPAALLPYHLAAAIHFLLNGAALIICFAGVERILMRHVFGAYAPKPLLRWILGLVCLAVLLSRELHLGNINLWLVAGLVLATEALLDGSHGSAGMLFGALWLIKPYLALDLVLLVVFRRWQAIGTAALTMGVGLGLPFLLLNPVQSWALHREWLTAMSAHSSYLSSPDTFLALAGRWLNVVVPSWSGAAMVCAYATLLGLIALRHRTKAGNEAAPWQEATLHWIAMASVPHLVVTDQEHFLYSAPLVLLLFAYVFKRKDLLVLMLMTSGLVLYASRSSDLWGSTREGILVEAGALGLGNVLLLAATLRVLHRR